jgi:hypothetical protein
MRFKNEDHETENSFCHDYGYDDDLPGFFDRCYGQQGFHQRLLHDMAKILAHKFSRGHSLVSLYLGPIVQRLVNHLVGLKPNGGAE